MPLQVLRSKSLPKVLTVFRSLETTITAAVDFRLSTIARMNGYPVPAHVIARVYKYLDLSSISALKKGIIKLRDISRFASDILATIPQIKVGRYQLNRSDISEYIEENKSSYGYDILTDTDIDLVTFLVTSSELMEAAWSLDLSAQAGGANPLLALSSLYHSLKTPTAYKILKKEVNFVGADVPHIYVASTDQVSPLNALPSMIRSIALRSAKDSVEQPEDVIKREDTLLRIADLRFLDHIISLLTNPDVWNTFIPARTKDDASANEERIKGLRLFSGYLHSLLLIPHFLRLELFRQSYLNFENWLKNFPVIPEDIERNYRETVVKYDIFQSSLDAAEIFRLHDESDSNLGASIKTFFTEFVTSFGLKDIVAKADKASVTEAQIQLTNLAQLRDNKFNYVMLSHPIGKYEMTYDLFQYLFDSDIFRQNMNDAFASIIPVVGKYLQDSVVEQLHTLGLRPSIPMHGHISAAHEYRNGHLPAIENNSYSQHYASISGDFETERTLQTELLYNVVNVRKLTASFPPLCMFDFDLATSFRTKLGRDWRTLYPSSIVPGDRGIDPNNLKNSRIELIQTLEHISGEHFEVIRRSFATPYTREIWATVLSSFCIIYEIMDDSFKPNEKQLSELASVVPGYGSPYGKTYDGLASMQNFTDADLIPVSETIYLAILKRVPLPSFSIGVGNFTLGAPYYYFSGNGSSVEVKRLCFGEGMLHYFLRPVSTLPDDPRVFFDKIYAYINDTLLLQADISLKLGQITEEKYKVSLPLIKQAWKNDRFSPLIDFIKISKYGQVANAGVATTETEIGKLMENIERTVEEAESASTVRNEEDTKNSLDVRLDTSQTDKDKDSSSKPHKKKKEKKDGEKDEADEKEEKSEMS